MSPNEIEKEIEKIREDNDKLLKNFKTWLEKDGLKEKTIDSHVKNCDFFINEFLVYEDAIPANEGGSYISMFLGYWFIKKAMWASPAAIKENGASLKKFYTFLLELGEIEEKDLTELTTTIKEEMPDWIATMKRYDDPEMTEMEVWNL
jgi:hypothetical protein